MLNIKIHPASIGFGFFLGMVAAMVIQLTSPELNPEPSDNLAHAEQSALKDSLVFYKFELRWKENGQWISGEAFTQPRNLYTESDSLHKDFYNTEILVHKLRENIDTVESRISLKSSYEKD